jgi:glutamate carboxypeptidase
VLVLAGMIGPASAQTSDSAESRLATSVDRSIPHALQLLERTVNVNSGTMNFAGVREVGEIFQDAFKPLGFSGRWIDGSSWGRSGHLFLERKGRSNALPVLCIGHLDTVFEKDSPFQAYQRLSETAARGPGVCDMKGGDVIMLLALEALRDAGALDDLHVIVALIGDEEQCGSPRELARRDLIEAAKKCRVVLAFENANGDPNSAVVARRGSSSWKLRTSGRRFHSSQIFREDVGSGAIFEASRILTAFHDSLTGNPLLTFNPGLILGGSELTFDEEQSRGTAQGKSNVVADTASVAGDLRAVSPEDLEHAKSTMRRLTAAHYPHTGAEITFEDGYPPYPATDGNRRLLEMLDRASRDLGFDPVQAVDPSRAGAADISFTSGIVPMGLDGLGLKGSEGHTLDETADLRSLPIQAKRVALLLYRLAKEPGR